MRAQPLIMVVDDDTDILHVLRRTLEKWGYGVETFSNPRFALRKFRQYASTYSVVLTDIQMPEMNGVALAKAMKTVKPSAKVIIMTAFEILADDFRLSLPDIREDDVLHKPFTITQVCQAVKKQLQAA
jgi:DNA-binding NtrC family response regulator